MRFKVKRTWLDDPTARPYTDTPAGPNPAQPGQHSEWYVDLPSLDALMAFVLEHGGLVVGTDGGEHYLELYDAYRESDPAGTERGDR